VANQLTQLFIMTYIMVFVDKNVFIINTDIVRFTDKPWNRLSKSLGILLKTIGQKHKIPNP